LKLKRKVKFLLLFLFLLLLHLVPLFLGHLLKFEVPHSHSLGMTSDYQAVIEMKTKKKKTKI